MTSTSWIALFSVLEMMKSMISVMTWQKRLSHYFIFFSFSFLLINYQWMRRIKVTHKEARDFSTGLGLNMCISRVENQTGTLSSSPCQTLIKEQLA